MIRRLAYGRPAASCRPVIAAWVFGRFGNNVICGSASGNCNTSVPSLGIPLSDDGVRSSGMLLLLPASDGDKAAVAAALVPGVNSSLSADAAARV